MSDVTDQVNENERLRAVLQGILDFKPKEENGDPYVQIAVNANDKARAALASKGMQSSTWEPSDVTMQDYWAAVVGGSYTPIRHGKHQSSHPVTVKRVLDNVRGTETADVIVGLIFWATMTGNREDMAWQRVRELERAAEERT